MTERFYRLTRSAIFVLRCSSAAAIALMLASWIGLPYPTWACISAVAVSQDKQKDTDSVAWWQFAGTVAGVATAALAGSLLDLVNAGTVLQISVSVALCAALARWKPELKVAMWTAPIVYLTRQGQETMLLSGLWRGAEVSIGGLVGVGLHWAVAKAAKRLPLPSNQDIA